MIVYTLQLYHQIMKTCSPTINLLSSGTYHLLTEEDRIIVNRIIGKKFIIHNGQPTTFSDILIRLSVSVDGKFKVLECGYLFEQGKIDEYIRIYPEKKGPEEYITRLPRVPLIYEKNGDITLRCSSKHMKEETEKEDVSTIGERVCYGILDKQKSPLNISMLSLCIQGNLHPSQKVIEELSKVSKSPKRYMEQYRCLLARRKHDLNTQEAVNIPYEVYLYDLTRVGQCNSKSDKVPDTSSHLLVPPSANAYLCLLRKSVKIIDQDLIFRFKYRPESCNITSGLIPDKRVWKRSRPTEEEVMINQVSNDMGNTNRVEIDRLKRRMNLPDSYTITWIKWYINILFSYRSKVLENR